MTAKEMFESLGYKQSKNNDNLIQYIAHNRDNGFVYIRFDLYRKGYEFGYFNGYIPTTMITSIKEHDAITQQMKELGWI